MERLKILLSGMVAGDPEQGGASWAVLQYVAGLECLGHQVRLVEPVASEAMAANGPVGSYFQSLPLLQGKAALLEKGRNETLGLPYRDLLEFARSADVLLNISGMLRDESLLDAVPVRAFLDLDPGFNQVWHETGVDMGIDLHTHFVTVGGRIGREDCPIPTLGRDWIPTLPPVSLEHWPAAGPAPAPRTVTSIGNWRSYGSIEYSGVHYGQRAHSMRRLIDLPGAVDAPLLLALNIHPDEHRDLEALRRSGWELVDPAQDAGTPERYAEFIRGSSAELCVAKSGYVDSRSGWFSDRSACYLASGRPVVAQDTGFGELLPSGAGLLAFGTTEEAAACLGDVLSSWSEHSRAARQLAEERLDARRVLSALLEELGASTPPTSPTAA